MCFLKFISLSTVLSIIDHLHFIKSVQHLDIEAGWHHDTFDIVRLNLKNMGADPVKLQLKVTDFKKEYIRSSDKDNTISIKPGGNKNIFFNFAEGITDAVVLFKDVNSKKYLLLRITKQNGKWKYKRGAFNQDYITIDRD